MKPIGIIKKFRKLLSSPYLYRTDIINYLIDLYGYQSYLEIGVQNKALNLNNVRCGRKVGVDPDPRAAADFVMTSNEFFEQNTDRFDIVLVDGLHQSEQVHKDILNSLMCLNNGGTIVCHDLLPTSEPMQHQEQTPDTAWTGDCWKAWVLLRMEREDLFMCVVDTDYGCGVIKRGMQNKLTNTENLTWKNFEKHKRQWLNLVSPRKFKKLLKNN